MRSRSATGLWWLLVVYFGFSSKCCQAQRYTDDSICRTPDGIDAVCVNVRQCQPILNVLRTIRRPHPPEVKKQLSSYGCFDRNKVCCPPGPIALNITGHTEIVYHDRDVAPDVTNHKNIDLLPKDCGYLDSSSRITNGENANLNEFPWMALLEYKTAEGRQFLCGGTIINYNYILTAAHCLNLKHGKVISVRVGEHSLKNETDCEVQNDKAKTLKCNPPVQDVRVEEIISHPQFGVTVKNLRNDIALLRVSRISKAGNVFPVCLPVGKTRDKVYYNVFVTGWGITSTQTNKRADILQKVGLLLSDKTTCSGKYSESGIQLTKTEFCAGGVDGKASCSGDSGGPVLVADVEDGNFIYVQHGIVSIGPNYCGVRGYPSVYTTVKYYMDWILDNMKP